MMNCSHNNFSYMHPVLSSYSIIVFFYMRYNLKHLYCIDITHVVVYNLKKKRIYL